MVKLAARIKYVKVYAKGGRQYVYYRRSGVERRILKEPDDVEGIRQEIARIEAEIAAERAVAPAFPEKSLGWLIQQYRASDWFTVLAPATQTSYLRAIAPMDRLKLKPLAFFDRPKILRFRDEAWHPAHGRWLANMTVTVLGILFKFAMDKGYVTVNPLEEKVRKLRKPRRKKGDPVPNRPWTADERRTVLEEAEPHVRLILALDMCTGLRKSDLFALTMGDVRDGEVAIFTNKRDEPISVPLHPLVRGALEGLPADYVGAIALRRDGKPYTADGFDTIWHRFRTRLEREGKVAKGLTLHGLRHTLGTMLKEAGLSDGEIADVLGQSTIAMARHYSRHAKLSDAVKEKVVNLPHIEGRKR